MSESVGGWMRHIPSGSTGHSSTLQCLSTYVNRAVTSTGLGFSMGLL